MRAAWIGVLPLLWVTACSRAPVITPLENTESALTASVSRDGRFLAYTTGNILRQSVRVRDLSSGADHEIFAPGVASYEHLHISPDNRYLYFSDFPWALYRVSLQGGRAQRLIVGKDAACSFSPDGSRLLVAIDGRLSIVDVTDSSMLPLPVSAPPGRLLLPAWSSDGSVYAFVLESPDSGMYLYTLPAGISQTWVARRLGEQAWSRIADVAWLPDHKAVVVAATKRAENAWHLWRIAYPQGTVERIGPEQVNDSGASIGDDGRLATVETESAVDLWVSPAEHPDQAWRIRAGDGRAPGSRGLAWTPDGRLLYTALRDGRLNLWVSDADGYQARQITFDHNNWLPRVTADGTVTYVSDRRGKIELWRMDLSRGHPHLATTLASPDGKWPPQPVSPNGLLAVVHPPQGPQQVVDTTGKVLRELRAGWQVQWTADGRALSYLDEGGGAINLWIQPLEGPPRQFTHFTTGGVIQYAWSADGRWLAFARGTQRTRIALMDGIR